MSEKLRQELEIVVEAWERRRLNLGVAVGEGGDISSHWQAQKVELECCLRQLRDLLSSATGVPAEPVLSCNHHSNCAAVDRKHPGGGHCHDPLCEAPAAEFCGQICPPLEAASTPAVSASVPCPYCHQPTRSRLRRTTPAGDDWALLRMAELRKSGEKARFRVNWATVRGNRFLWLSIRRADGSLESRPRPDDYVEEDD